MQSPIFKTAYSFKKIKLYIVTTVVALSMFSFTLKVDAQTVTDSSYHYTHQISQGFGARILKCAAKLFLPKNSIPRKLAREDYVSDAAPIPKKIVKEFQIDTIKVQGRNVYTFVHKDKKAGKYVLFLHGGAYINNIFSQHWNFVAKIVRETHYTFIVPDYPLAPASNYSEAFAMLSAVYKSLLSRAGDENIIFMGDSAGGGLALAFAQQQKLEGNKLPEQLILLSPWLDVTMTNPEIKDIQKKDVTLRADNLILAGKAWAGTSDPADYLISPVYGSLQGLPRISIFIGTYDILIADCRKLKSMAVQQGVPMNYFEYPKMFHDWVMLVSLKESKQAMSQICSLITGS